MELKCEVAVIGSGPGGAVTAHYLAKSGFDVCLIEEGRSVSRLPVFSIHEIHRNYRNAGLTMALGRPSIPYVEASCLGGGSEVNSGLYQSCPEEIFKDWKLQNHVEGLNDFHHHYQALEEEFFEENSSIEVQGIARKLQDAADLRGWKWAKVPQLKISEGFRKKTMSQTYIKWAVDSGARLLCETRVKKLRRTRSGGWKIKALEKNQKAISIKASYVFVCAGAIHSANLLLKSGIHQNIGLTLAMHPTLKVVAQFDDPVEPLHIYPGNIQIKQFSPEINFGCSVSAAPYLAATLTAHPEQMHLVQDQPKRSMVYYVSLRGESTGRISPIIGMKDPFVFYKLSKQKQNQLWQGLDNLNKLLFSVGAKNIAQPFYVGSKKKLKLSNYHLFATVPFGENRKICAANSYGQVFGNQNLYVSDASLLCSAIGVNPQATIMAVARRNALHFVAKNKKPL